MAKILFLTDNHKKCKLFGEMTDKNPHDFLCAFTLNEAVEKIKLQNPDLVILDTEIKSFDLKSAHKKIRAFNDNLQTILITKTDDIDPELLKNSNAFLKEPVAKDFLLATINANIKTKNSLEMLSDSNRELARSLYQLNVLYNTSSRFAGTLDKNKLIDFMVEGLDKSLSFGLACVLTFRSMNEPVLIINSLYQISDRLLEAIKLRTILNYKSLFEKKEMPFELNIENLKIEKHFKHTIKEYDFSVLRYDNIFAPINLSEKFFGFIEIYREADFTTEDTTCFQTIVQQVSLPLKSASLYEEIKKTNQKLERLERLKSEFISIVSHELRTPLTAIKNSLDILLSGKSGILTETADKFINMAKRNAARLSGIINDLLDLSKIEAGKMDFKFALTTIEPVIDYVRTSLEEMAKEKGLVIVSRIEDDKTKIYADTRRLEQVLTNLVSNAIKFTNEGGKIEICSQVVDAGEIQIQEGFEEDLKKLVGKYIVVRVKDNGIGIAYKDLVHVFDKFAQIENSLSRKVGGSGLGLPIARQLLDVHNGAIWCNSKPEKGSSFYFAIPVADEMNNFMLEFKQAIQKTKVSNSVLTLVKMQGENDLITSLLEDKHLINKNYLKNSIQALEGKNKNITIVIPDGDKFSADFLKKKIQTYLKDHENLFPKCAIMYSYAIYPNDGADEWELMKRANETLKKLRG